MPERIRNLLAEREASIHPVLDLAAGAVDVLVGPPSSAPAADDRQRQRHELTSHAILGWQAQRGVAWHFIAPGKPMQNGLVESLIGRLRDECLNEHLFRSLPAARHTLKLWRLGYNTQRPHTSLDGLALCTFANRSIMGAPGTARGSFRRKLSVFS